MKHFPTDKEIADLQPHIRKLSDKNLGALQQSALDWTRTAWENRMDYEVTWFGVPIIQNPYDMILMQELIFQLKPTVILETGIAHGGSLIYYSSLLDLLGDSNSRVIGIDIEIRPHNRRLIEQHPFSDRITMLEASSVEQATLDNVKNLIKSTDKVMVILDSNHTKDHVLKELNLYTPLVSPESYCVVFDTFMPKLQGLNGAGKDFDLNTAWHAVQDFIKDRSEFMIDHHFNKFFVSSCPDGFLRRRS